MKDVIGYEGYYKVTKDGRVWSCPRNNVKRGAWLKLTNANGYKRVHLSKDNIKRCESVHRLVAKAFVPNPNALPCVNHKDANRSSNHYTNLEWVTPKQNSEHAAERGLYKPSFGELHPDAKLTDAEVILIRKLHKQGVSLYKLAARFPATVSTIHAACQRRTWKHI